MFFFLNVFLIKCRIIFTSIILCECIFITSNDMYQFINNPNRHQQTCKVRAVSGGITENSTIYLPLAGLRTGQAGLLLRGLHNQGASTYVLSPFIFWYSRVEWASTAPLLKAAQGPSQPGAYTYVLSPFIIWYSRVGWASTAPLLKAAQGPPRV